METSQLQPPLPSETSQLSPPPKKTPFQKKTVTKILVSWLSFSNLVLKMKRPESVKGAQLNSQLFCQNGVPLLPQHLAIFLGDFFDQKEGTKNFSKYRPRELTKVVEVAGFHSGKEISFMFLFEQPPSGCPWR